MINKDIKRDALLETGQLLSRYLEDQTWRLFLTLDRGYTHFYKIILFNSNPHMPLFDIGVYNSL
jgi:hypothetical protein